MSTSTQARPFPYELRLEHEGCMSIRAEWAGRTLHFDPIVAPVEDAIIILTWCWPEHLEATAAAVSAGVCPTVVAPRPVLHWLGGFGALDAHEAPCEIDGLKIEGLAYRAIENHTQPDTKNRVMGMLQRPLPALRRLRKKRGLPSCEPVAVGLTFPSGRRLVHLNLSLHTETPIDWLEDAVRTFGGAEWMLVGVDHGEDDSVLARVARFGARRILFTDLLGDVRTSLGMPATVLTPLADQAISEGLDAYVFCRESGYRFEFE